MKLTMLAIGSWVLKQQFSFNFVAWQMLNWPRNSLPYLVPHESHVGTNSMKHCKKKPRCYLNYYFWSQVMLVSSVRALYVTLCHNTSRCFSIFTLCWTQQCNHNYVIQGVRIFIQFSTQISIRRFVHVNLLITNIQASCSCKFWW